MYNKVKKSNKKKGSSIVEFLVVVPVLIVFLFATWHIYEMSSNKIKLVKVARHLAWEKVDYTGGEGGSDPNPGDQVIFDAIDFYGLKNENISQMHIENNVSVKEGLMDVILYESATSLRLTTKGLWEGKITYKIPSIYSDVINSLSPGNPVDDHNNVSESCWLLTDSWNAVNQSDKKDKGQVRERIKGYWIPLGLVPFIDGDDIAWLWDILDFEIKLPWPFGNKPLCEEQPPRVNLESVPDRV